jgi:hypothetical protein
VGSANPNKIVVMIILPTSYFGSTEYWTAIIQGGDDVVVDLGENYVKRSERNRTSIMTSGGVMQLSVQLSHANRPRQPITAMRVDYSKRWQHQHIVAIESAYRSAPYFEHYADRILPILERRWDNLVELNMAVMEQICKILRVAEPRQSASYIAATECDVDMRLKQRGSTFVAEPYIQVFSDRLPFEPNLSIIDLIMCEGPEARSILSASQL